MDIYIFFSLCRVRGNTKISLFVLNPAAPLMAIHQILSINEWSERKKLMPQINILYPNPDLCEILMSMFEITT